mgnify:CR=1 FL=1
MKLFAKNFGCKTNFSDLASIVGKISTSTKEKVEITNIESEADLAIINSCAVTLDAEREVIKSIRKIRKNKPDIKVLVSGCMTRVSSHKILKEGAEIMPESQNIDAPEFFVQGLPFFSKRRAYLKIQEGCSRFCSFCIIPYTRGNPVSLELNKIIETAKSIGEKGYEEIVLVGTHLSLWGQNDNGNGNSNSKGKSLSRIVERFSEEKPIKRLRFSSLSPGEIDDDFIRALKDAKDIICPHFHISVQSGDNNILRAMRRWHTFEDFLRDCDRLLSEFEDACIGTDIIVGFPLEDDRSFETTVKKIEASPLGHIHVFPYSDRLTPSSFIKKRYNPKVLDDRIKVMLSIAKEKRYKFAKRFINRKLDVIFEEELNDFVEGLSRNYVKIITDKKLNSETKIEIKEITEYKNDIFGVA